MRTPVPIPVPPRCRTCDRVIARRQSGYGMESRCDYLRRKFCGLGCVVTWIDLNAKHSDTERALPFDGFVLAIQAECNADPRAVGDRRVDILNAEEEARIRELIAAGTWPDKWDGTEPTGDELLDKVFADGSVQPLLPMFGTKEVE